MGTPKTTEKKSVGIWSRESTEAAVDVNHREVRNCVVEYLPDCN